MDVWNFFGELRRRHVYKVAAAYVVVAWLLIQDVTQTFPFFEIPNWAVRLVILLLVIGFPICLIITLGVRAHPLRDTAQRRCLAAVSAPPWGAKRVCESRRRSDAAIRHAFPPGLPR